MSEPFNRLTETRHGPMLFNANDTWMAKSLLAYGEYSPGEARLLCACLRPGAVAVDLGANIGALTIPMARTVGPTGAVIAFEPQRIMYHVLVANIALNSLTNVWPNQGAIGNARGTIECPQFDPNVEQSFVGCCLDVDKPKVLGVPTQAVPIMPLDDLQLGRCDLIKADVEGMELDAMKGAADTIARLHPILYLEATFAEKRAALLAWLDAAGYDAYWDTPPFFVEDNWLHNTEDVFRGPNGELTISHNWLCIPRGKPVEVTGRRVTAETLHDTGALTPMGMVGAPADAGKVLGAESHAGAAGPGQ